MLVALLLIALCVVAWVLLNPRVPEPIYNGKRLSYWAVCYTSAGRGITNELPAAIHAAGTNAIPTLLRLLKKKDPLWKEKLGEFAGGKFMSKVGFVSAAAYHREAVNGFDELGTDARNAVPALIEIYEEEIYDDGQADRAYHDAAIILKSLGPAAKAAVPAFRRAANSDNARIRGEAIRALGMIHSEPELVVPTLVKHLTNSPHSEQWDTLWALALFGPDASNAVPALLHAADSTNNTVRYEAFYALSRVRLKPELAVLKLLNCLTNSPASEQSDVMRALGHFGAAASNAVPALLQVANGTNNPQRGDAWYTLGQIHSKPEMVVPVLIARLESSSRQERMSAMHTLWEYGPDASNAVPALTVILRDRSNGAQPGAYYYPRGLAAEVLGRIGPSAAGALPEMKLLLEDESPFVRGQAAIAIWHVDSRSESVLLPALAQAMEQSQDKMFEKPWLIFQLSTMGTQAQAAVPLLTNQLSSTNEIVRRGASNALRRIDPETAARILGNPPQSNTNQMK